MSWRFPRYELNDQDVIDTHAWNENAAPFVEEGSGGLNEHNFALNAFNAPASWADDIGFRLHHAAVAVDPNGLAAGSAGWNAGRRQNATTFDIEAVPATFARLTMGSGWEQIENMELSFITPAYGSQVWVNFSGQFEVWPASDVDTDRVASSGEFGMMVALRVDGQVVYEAMLGSGELANDPVGVFGGKTTFPGIYARRYPVALDYVVDLPPGPHTIDVVCYSESANFSKSYFVSNRELIGLEMF